MPSFANSLGIPIHLMNPTVRASMPSDLTKDNGISLTLQQSLQDALENSTFSETSSSDTNTNDSSSESDSDDEPNRLAIAFNPLDGPSNSPTRFEDADEGDLANAFNSRCLINGRGPRGRDRAVTFSGRIGPSRRIVSTSSPNMANNTHRPVVSAPASFNRTPSGRSPSVHLRHAALVNAFHQSRGQSDGPGSESSSDHSQDAENDSSSDSDDEAPTLAEIRKRNSLRSAASKRLFAALGSRDKSAGKTDEGKTTNSEQPNAGMSASSLPASTPGLSAHRGLNARLPSLNDLRSRVVGKSGPATSLFGAKRSPTSQPAGFTPMHNRSVSCPTPRTGNWWQFGDVMVTITPPTPQMQPKSPILGYVLQSNGRVINSRQCSGSQDDLIGLVPPPFEVAPGRQKIFEERRKAAMEAMAALQAANDQAQRSVNNGCGGLVGLGWPGQQAQECPVPPVMVAAAAAAATVEMPKRALLAPPSPVLMRRMQGRHSVGQTQTGRQRVYFSPPPAGPPPPGASSPSPPRRRGRQSNPAPKLAVSVAAAQSFNWRSSMPCANSPPTSPTKGSSDGSSSAKYVAPGRRSLEGGPASPRSRGAPHTAPPAAACLVTQDSDDEDRGRRQDNWRSLRRASAV